MPDAGASVQALWARPLVCSGPTGAAGDWRAALIRCSRRFPGRDGLRTWQREPGASQRPASRGCWTFQVLGLVAVAAIERLRMLRYSLSAPGWSQGMRA